jgi:hypothetical protein
MNHVIRWDIAWQRGRKPQSPNMMTLGLANGLQLPLKSGGRLLKDLRNESFLISWLKFDHPFLGFLSLNNWQENE